MKIVNVTCLLAGLFWLCVSPGKLAAGQIFQDETRPLEARVDDLLSRLTLEEKFPLSTPIPSSPPPRFHIWAFCTAGWTTAHMACAKTSDRTRGGGPGARMILPPWPVAASGFVVQPSPSLGENAVWTVVTNADLIAGSSNQLLPPATNATMFFQVAQIRGRE